MNPSQQMLLPTVLLHITHGATRHALILLDHSGNIDCHYPANPVLCALPASMVFGGPACRWMNALLRDGGCLVSRRQLSRQSHHTFLAIYDRREPRSHTLCCVAFVVGANQAILVTVPKRSNKITSKNNKGKVLCVTIKNRGRIKSCKRRSIIIGSKWDEARSCMGLSPI